MSYRPLSEIGYTAYRDSIYYDNPTLPAYLQGLPTEEIEAWEAVAEAIRDEVGKQLVRSLIV